MYRILRIWIFIGKDPTESQIDAVYKALDVNKDGKISYDEFANNFLCRIHIILHD